MEFIQFCAVWGVTSNQVGERGPALEAGLGAVVGLLGEQQLVLGQPRGRGGERGGGGPPVGQPCHRDTCHGNAATEVQQAE